MCVATCYVNSFGLYSPVWWERVVSIFKVISLIGCSLTCKNQLKSETIDSLVFIYWFFKVTPCLRIIKTSFCFIEPPDAFAVLFGAQILVAFLFDHTNLRKAIKFFMCSNDLMKHSASLAADLVQARLLLQLTEMYCAVQDGNLFRGWIARTSPVYICNSKQRETVLYILMTVRNSQDQLTVFLNFMLGIRFVRVWLILI